MLVTDIEEYYNIVLFCVKYTLQIHILIRNTKYHGFMKITYAVAK